jgi:hypothetical protein
MVCLMVVRPHTALKSETGFWLINKQDGQQVGNDFDRPHPGLLPQGEGINY